MNRKEKKVLLRGLILNRSLDEVENHYRCGLIPQDIWELYCSLWRNTGTRLSSVMISYDRPWKELAKRVYAEARAV